MRSLSYPFVRFCLLLGGCRPLSFPVVPTGTATILPTPKPTDPPLTLNPCAVTNGLIKTECGTLRVTEDRTNPAGRLLELGIVIVRAREPDPEPDPLFYITGGPGGVATAHDNVSTAATIFLEVNARRDIVYLDQRGTNDKHRLTCEPMPDEVANGTQQQVNDWMKECLSSLDGDPRFYTTAEAMRDLDAAREALGYGKINLYGGSYGASAIQVYMRMFPQRVRAAVLDHGTALDQPFFQALPNASQFALDHIFTLCEQDEKCHAAYPYIRGDWKSLLDRLSRGPVVTSFILPEAKDPLQVGMDSVVEGLHNTMFKYGGYAKVPLLIHTYATNEDWTPLAKQSYSEQQGELSQPSRFLLMQQMIYCFEPAWGNLPDEIARLNPDSYLRDFQVKLAQGQQKTCAALPKPDPALIYGPGKPAPLSALMLNSLIDPQNPPPNMALALKEFTKSRLVTETTEGHETSSNSVCRWGIITQYIQQGSVDGLDISCMEKQKPSFVIGN